MSRVTRDFLVHYSSNEEQLNNNPELLMFIADVFIQLPETKQQKRVKVESEKPFEYSSLNEKFWWEFDNKVRNYFEKMGTNAFELTYIKL